MRQWTESSLDQIMPCRLLGAKTLSEPKLTYCELDPKEYISMKFHFEFKSFHWRKCVWKCRPPIGGLFVLDSICEDINGWRHKMALGGSNISTFGCWLKAYSITVTSNYHHGVSIYRLIEYFCQQFVQMNNSNTKKGSCYYAFVTGIFLHKGIVTRKMCSFDGVIMQLTMEWLFR